MDIEEAKRVLETFGVNFANYPNHPSLKDPVYYAQRYQNKADMIAQNMEDILDALRAMGAKVLDYNLHLDQMDFRSPTVLFNMLGIRLSISLFDNHITVRKGGTKVFCVEATTGSFWDATVNAMTCRKFVHFIKREGRRDESARNYHSIVGRHP